MKKIFIAFLMLVGLVYISSCGASSAAKYSLVITDNRNLLDTKPKAKYKAGSNVKLLTKSLDNDDVVILLDSIYYLSGEEDKASKTVEFSFEMPTSDTVLTITSKNEAKLNKTYSYYDNEALSKSFQDEINYNFCLTIKYYFSDKTSYIDGYYGNYNGAYALKIQGTTPHQDTVVTIKIDGIEFIYYDSVPIQIYYNQKIYDLEIAYNLGIITRNDLETLAINFKK